MSPAIQITKSSPQTRAKKQKESDRRIRDWLLDPGLDIQGRLLAGPAELQDPEMSSTDLQPEAHL
ncbi:hypothetical protein ACHAQD_004469 [Fusarium lateritium]